MRAVQQQELTGPDGLGLVELPRPTPVEGQVLVKVAAAGVSFPDLLLSQGRYQVRMEPPYVPGVEVAGEVVADAGEFHAGDQVAAFLGSGGWAEYAAAPLTMTVRVPANLPLIDAAGMLMNYQTALFGLQRRGAVRAGDTVLVHGAAGGVGTACIQVARGLGARVIAVASTPAKQQVAHAAGADEVVALDGWLAAVRELTARRGVDVIADPVGEPVISDSLRALAPEGRHLVLGFAGGGIPSVAANRLLLNNVSLVGVAWGAFLATEPELFARQWKILAGWVESGIVRPVVSQTFLLEQAADAVRAVQDRSAEGKVTLVVSG